VAFCIDRRFGEFVIGHPEKSRGTSFREVVLKRSIHGDDVVFGRTPLHVAHLIAQVSMRATASADLDTLDGLVGVSTGKDLVGIVVWKAPVALWIDSIWSHLLLYFLLVYRPLVFTQQVLFRARAGVLGDRVVVAGVIFEPG
jgi:hypothetical protein